MRRPIGPAVSHEWLSIAGFRLTHYAEAFWEPGIMFLPGIESVKQAIASDEYMFGRYARPDTRSRGAGMFRVWTYDEVLRDNIPLAVYVR